MLRLKFVAAQKMTIFGQAVTEGQIFEVDYTASIQKAVEKGWCYPVPAPFAAMTPNESGLTWHERIMKDDLCPS